LLSLVERFEAIGKTTGVITTVPFSHATPAGMVAHNPTRNNYQEIAEEMIQMSGLDVIIGVEKNSNWKETLMIITSDHECGYLTGPGSGKADSAGLLWKPIVNHGQGKLPGMMAQWPAYQSINSVVCAGCRFGKISSAGGSGGFGSGKIYRQHRNCTRDHRID